MPEQEGWGSKERRAKNKVSALMSAVDYGKSKNLNSKQTLKVADQFFDWLEAKE